MAILILRGLLSSLALNIIVLPAFYWLYGERGIVAHMAELPAAIGLARAMSCAARHNCPCKTAIHRFDSDRRLYPATT